MKKYVVVDLEMCDVVGEWLDEERRYKNELIQIGAALINENNEVIDEFSSFVHPEFGTITNRITKLTGITNDDVKNAKNAREVLNDFIDWVPDDAIFVAWSENDKKQLEREILKKNIVNMKLNKLLETAIDCQEEFAVKMHDSKRYRLSEALIIADIYYEEGMHDALVDARNTALLYIKMINEPELKLNKYYVSSDSLQHNSTFFSLGSLLAATRY